MIPLCLRAPHWERIQASPTRSPHRFPRREEWGTNHAMQSPSHGTSTTGTANPKSTVLLMRERVVETPSMAKATGRNPWASPTCSSLETRGCRRRYSRAASTEKAAVRMQCFAVPTFFSKLPAKYQVITAPQASEIRSW